MVPATVAGQDLIASSVQQKGEMTIWSKMTDGNHQRSQKHVSACTDGSSTRKQLLVNEIPGKDKAQPLAGKCASEDWNAFWGITSVLVGLRELEAWSKDRWYCWILRRKASVLSGGVCVAGFISSTSPATAQQKIIISQKIYQENLSGCHQRWWCSAEGQKKSK